MNIEKIKGYLSKPLIAAGVGFLIGLIIGLPILGWGVFPVKWVDAAPEHLREDLKADYLRMAIHSFGIEQDPQAALLRWEELGSDRIKILDELATDPKLQAKDIIAFRGIVMSAPGVEPVGEAQPEQPSAGEETTVEENPEEQPTQAIAAPGGPELTVEVEGKKAAKKEDVEKEGTGMTNWVILLGVFCLLTLVIGGALFYILVVRKRGLGGESMGPQISDKRVEHDYYEEDQTPPTAQFMTTYVYGDDLYDDSFSIDSPSGEFLGECGVGISEVIGVGDPKKVTAFEVWLFDKNDIQTVTKVFMSEHAFNDPVSRQRLLSKGEPVLIRPDERILLETATLQLEAKIVDQNYGQGAMPEKSYLERLTLELAVWPRR